MRIDDWSSDVCSADLRERGKPMAGSYGEWLQLWPYAILMIAIASWLLYHFLAPASWQDWTGAGLVQAFIIAPYADMYGFPLTIYFLTSVLSVEIPLVPSSGHLLALLLGYGPRSDEATF